MEFKSQLGWDSFYIQLVLKIVTPCLTGLAFLTGLYSGIVQELASYKVSGYTVMCIIMHIASYIT